MGIQFLKKIVSRIFEPKGSISVDDPEVIKAFTDNPDFPYLVSFSRTGSHWLRMIMELYFEKPSLVRIFYFLDATQFTCYHTHDMDLKLRRENIIYLYRNPVETIYSQLCYYGENQNDTVRLQYWTDLYARHLGKWLVHDDFTRKKTVITYEGMMSDMHGEIKKICEHFDVVFDPVALDSVLRKVSKGELKKKSQHDQQVVNITNTYKIGREEFRNNHGTFILDNLYAMEPLLKRYFAKKIIKMDSINF